MALVSVTYPLPSLSSEVSKSKLFQYNMALWQRSKLLCFVQIVVFSDIVSTSLITERAILLFIPKNCM
jgi:hypothetical protein